MIGRYNTPFFRALVNAKGEGGGPPDEAPPTLAWTIAANGLSADGVSPESLDDSITLDLSDFLFHAPSGTAPSESSISYQTTTNANDTVRVVFATPWYEPEGNGITVDVAAGAVEDLAGNPNAAATGGAVANGSTVWPATVVSAVDASDVNTSGPNVTRMNDVSGQGNHITSAGADPALDSVTYGVPVVAFNGTSHEMNLPAAWCSYLTGAADRPFSVIMSMRLDSVTVNLGILIVGATNANYAMRLRNSAGDILRLNRSDGTLDPPALSDANYPNVTWLTAGVFFSGIAASFTVGSSTSKTGGGAIDVDAPTPTSRGFVGSRGGSQFMAMQLARAVFCDSDVAGRDHAVLQAWVNEATLAA